MYLKAVMKSKIDAYNNLRNQKSFPKAMATKGQNIFKV